MAQPKIDLGRFYAEGMELESLNFKAPEDPEDKKLRLFKEKWSFFGKELATYFVSYLFVILVGAYCCIVIVRHGPIASEARAVFPLLTTLFGGVLGVIVGKGSK